MNQYQQTLYNDLMALVKNSEAFYFADQILEGKTYRLFNYRLASYTDFLAPSALECRGHMFEVDPTVGDENGYDMAIRLAALPMSKFHNLNECPFTQNLDLSQITEIQVKADGSLMSTYIHSTNGRVDVNSLRLKSKGSLSSDQAIAAMKWLDTQPFFKVELAGLTVAGLTINLEWCSPEHRIVLGYMEPHLKILNARRRDNGEYLVHGHLCEMFGEDCVIKNINTDDPTAFVAAVPEMQDDIEGFVVTLENGLRFKIKTAKYLSLHHAKDSINNPRRLFEAILDEGIDDLRSLFYTDPVAIMMIDEMQKKVDHLYNHMVKLVETFYEENKHLERKEYAIKGQSELERMFFGLAMNKYVGKDPEYKVWMKKHYKDFGIKDDAVLVEGG